MTGPNPSYGQQDQACSAGNEYIGEAREKAEKLFIRQRRSTATCDMRSKGFGGLGSQYACFHRVIYFGVTVHCTTTW